MRWKAAASRRISTNRRRKRSTTSTDPGRSNARPARPSAVRTSSRFRWGRYHLAQEFGDAVLAHATGVGQLSGACRIEDLVGRREYDDGRDAILQRHAVGFRDGDVAIEPADVDLDNLELARDERCAGSLF